MIGIPIVYSFSNFLNGQAKSYISRLLHEGKTFFFDGLEVLIFGGHATRQTVNDLSEKGLAPDPVDLET